MAHGPISHAVTPRQTSLVEHLGNCVLCKRHRWLGSSKEYRRVVTWVVLLCQVSNEGATLQMPSAQVSLVRGDVVGIWTAWNSWRRALSKSENRRGDYILPALNSIYAYVEPCQHVTSHRSEDYV